MNLFLFAKREDVECIQGSHLFDAEWYLAQYPDVKALGMNPAEHYLWLGARLGRNPSRSFDSAGYLRLNSDVAVACFNPLLHYVRSGEKEGRMVVPSSEALGFVTGNGEGVADFIHAKHGSIRRSYEIFDENLQRKFLQSISDLRRSCKLYDDISVSVIMPTFNRAETLSKAIESVLAQSHRNWELLVIDDGSTDNTHSVVKPFLEDNRIRYACLDHGGVSSARNAGLLCATGELVAYLDSDNTWEANFLRNMAAFIFSQGLDAAYCAIEAIDDEGETRRYRGDVFLWSACMLKSYIDLNPFVHRRTLAINDYRRELFDNALRRLVDWDFILRVTAEAKVSYAPFVGVNYYDGANGRRITRTVYKNGELPTVVSTIRAKHEHRGPEHENVDAGAGLRLAKPQRRASLNDDRYILRFFPDYRINNAYQSLLYGSFVNYEIQPGTIDHCLKLALALRRGEARRIIFHLHWLNPVVSGARTTAHAAELVDLFLAKARLFVSLGGRILWTVHNIVSHEPRFLEEEVRLSKGLVALAEWIHVHHPAVSEATKSLYELPPEKLVVAEHGNYIGTLPISMSREQARQELGMPNDANVFLFLGQIRGYKGIDELIDAFSEISATGRGVDCWLVVAGKILRMDKRELRDRLTALPNTVFRPGYVADDQMQVYLKSADALVLPYRKVLTSGSVFLGMSFGLPVICPRTGLLAHVVEDGENGLLYDADDLRGLGHAMRRFLDAEQDDKVRMGALALRTAEANRWEESAAKLRRYIEGVDFGRPVRTHLPQSQRIWFIRGELETLKGKECVAVILHYRHVEDTKICVDSVLAQGEDVGLILISNSESLSDIRALAALYPDIVAVQAEGNIGYAAANNFGLWACQQIQSEFFWILNPDVVVPPSYYEGLVRRTEAYPDHDFFASTLVSSRHPNRVLFCGGGVALDRGAKPSHMYMGKPISDLPDQPFECDYLTGSNIFGRTKALQKIGYMPERYFLYFEETDWFTDYLTKGKGCKPLIFPDLIAQNNKRSEDSGLPEPYYIYYFCRNFLLFGRKFTSDRLVKCADETRKFANLWLKRIARRAPGRLHEFEALVERAFEDAHKGREGKAAL